MNLSDLTLDQQIDREHAALERAEADALAIEQRMANIGGAAATFARSKRSYGTPPNPWATGHLSAQVAVQQADPALAAYLARAAGKSLMGPDYDRIAAEEKRAASAMRLMEETKRLREARETRQKQRKHAEQWGQWDIRLGMYR